MTLTLGVLTAVAACAGFPQTLPNTQTKSRASEGLLVELPKDVRTQNLGSQIAKTDWEACAEDALRPGEAVSLLHERIAEALTQSAVFQSVSRSSAKQWTLKSEVRAFCSQTRGFVYRRVAGIVALDFTLKHDGVIVWQASKERVVTDVDPDYTGPAVVMTKVQAMQASMADALRLVLRDAISEIDKAVANKEKLPSK